MNCRGRLGPHLQHVETRGWVQEGRQPSCPALGPPFASWLLQMLPPLPHPISIPLCNESCRQIPQGHVARAHTKGCLCEVTSGFLTKLTWGPFFSLCWLQACLRPTGLVSVSVLASVWSWPQLTPGDGHLITPSSPGCLCHLFWLSPGGWSGPEPREEGGGTRLVWGLRVSAGCSVSAIPRGGPRSVTAMAGAEARPSCGRSQPTRDGCWAVCSEGMGSAGVLAAVRLRKGRVLPAGLQIKEKSSAQPLQSPAAQHAHPPHTSCGTR